MATKLKSEDERPRVTIPLGPIPAIPLEHAELDPAKRDAAWRRLQTVMDNPPEPVQGASAPGDYGTRESWYEDRKP